MPVSGSSCANLFWIGAAAGEAGDSAAAGETAAAGAGGGGGEGGTEAALQELAGRLEPWYLVGDPTDLEERLADLSPPFHSQLYIIHREAKVWKVWELYNVGGERVKHLVATWWPDNLTSNLVEAERWERPLFDTSEVPSSCLGGRGEQILEESPSG